MEKLSVLPSSRKVNFLFFLIIILFLILLGEGIYFLSLRKNKEAGKADLSETEGLKVIPTLPFFANGYLDFNQLFGERSNGIEISEEGNSFIIKSRPEATWYSFYCEDPNCWLNLASFDFEISFIYRLGRILGKQTNSQVGIIFYNKPGNMKQSDLISILINGRRKKISLYSLKTHLDEDVADTIAAIEETTMENIENGELVLQVLQVNSPEGQLVSLTNKTGEVNILNKPIIFPFSSEDDKLSFKIEIGNGLEDFEIKNMKINLLSGK